MSVQSSDKWRYTLYTTFVLLILFNPWTYTTVDSLLSRFVGRIASPGGCPTMLGFLVHAVLFTLVVRYMMDLRL
jgi:hypothetical protein